ncbi:Uncharacterised protein [Citrobacter koseri]|nr:Uncharacterised protein [Citrobacter koseri]
MVSPAQIQHGELQAVSGLQRYRKIALCAFTRQQRRKTQFDAVAVGVRAVKFTHILVVFQQFPAFVVTAQFPFFKRKRETHGAGKNLPYPLPPQSGYARPVWCSAAYWQSAPE